MNDVCVFTRLMGMIASTPNADSSMYATSPPGVSPMAGHITGDDGAPRHSSVMPGYPARPLSLTGTAAVAAHRRQKHRDAPQPRTA
ncbi:MAG: hypothetical protein ACLSHC_02155 [Bilophila wadsworthia]